SAVTGDRAVADGQRPGIGDAPSGLTECKAIADGQAREPYRGAAAYREDAVVAAGVPPHGQEVGPRPLDADAPGQIRQGPRQVDRTLDEELNAALVLGLLEAVAQVADELLALTHVGEAVHQADGQEGAIFEPVQVGLEARPGATPHG